MPRSLIFQAVTNIRENSRAVIFAIRGSLGFSEISLCFLQNTHHDFPLNSIDNEYGQWESQILQ